MEIARATLDAPSTRCTYRLHHLTDLHDGSPDHAEAELDERIAEIAADPHALWVGGGDYGDLIVPGDPRFQADGVAEDWADHMARIPDYYLERLERRLRPIADKCVGLAAGNHEATIGKRYHRGVAAELAMRLGKPTMYLGDRGWSIITFRLGSSTGRKLTVSVYTYHGWSAGRLKGRKAIQAERDLGAWNADVLLLGHDHQPYADPWWTEEPYPTKNGWRIRQRPRVVVNGGSWTYGQKPPTSSAVKELWRPSNAPGQSWVEGKNFRPQPPECPIVEVHLDFGNGANEDRGAKGRPAGVSFGIRRHANPHYVGATG